MKGGVGINSLFMSMSPASVSISIKSARSTGACLAAGLLCVSFVAACGGGGSDQAVADPLAEVPAGASQSSAGMAGYMRMLATLQVDRREPLTVDAFNPPRPDDTEPEAVGG